MSIIQSIMNKFNELAARRARYCHHQKLLQEMIPLIKSEDVNGIHKLWSSIEDKAAFIRTWKWVDIVSDARAGTVIMKAAIDTDNLGVFQACFDHMPNPNTPLSFTYSSPSRGECEIKTSILKYAIDEDKGNIALFLAGHPDLDVSTQEHQKIIMEAQGKMGVSAANRILAQRAPV